MSGKAFISTCAGSILRGVLSALMVLGFLLSVPYYHTEIYRKQKAIPFNGSFLYNPYELYQPNPIKANFHAHSIAFWGLTNGSQPPQEVFSHYYNNGYDIISLSNYQTITKDNYNANYIPVYEHGYNIRKSHRLVINADAVSYFDFPLFQSYHHKQQVLKKLHNEGSLIAIAHPLLLNGYNMNDFEYLQGYHLIEVFNNKKNYVGAWDKALSSGHLVWLIANDDTHNIRRTDRTFVSWTRIGVNDNCKRNVLNALAMGCHYGVMNRSNQEYNQLVSCRLHGNTITVQFKRKAQSIAFITDGGTIQKVEYETDRATYTINTTDRYVRIEARSQDELICLNPIIRYDGINLPFPNTFPPLDIFRTILFRVLVLAVHSGLVILFLAVNPKLRFQLFRRLGWLRQIKMG